MKSWKLALLLLRRPFAIAVVSIYQHHVPEITDWSCFAVTNVDYGYQAVNEIKIKDMPCMS